MTAMRGLILDISDVDEKTVALGVYTLIIHTFIFLILYLIFVCEASLYLCASSMSVIPPAIVAQHVVHPLVAGEVIGSNLGPTPRQN